MTEGNIEGNITSLNGENIEKVEDFVYLGSKIRASESDIDARKAKAWAACHKLKQIWKSDLRKAIKVRLFTALIESVLLYGSETWTMTKRLNKVLDGCYTRMLRMVSKSETPETCRACYPPSRATTVQSDSLEACPWAQRQRAP